MVVLYRPSELGGGKAVQLPANLFPGGCVVPIPGPGRLVPEHAVFRSPGPHRYSGTKIYLP